MSNDGTFKVGTPDGASNSAVDSVANGESASEDRISIVIRFPKRRKWSWRWPVPRFSLRAIMILMTVLCLILGWSVFRAERQRAVYEELTSNGWECEFDPIDTSARPYSFGDDIDEKYGPWWLKGFSLEWRRSHGVHYWRTVEIADNKGASDPEMLAVVAQLPALHTLSFAYDNYPADSSVWRLVGRLRTLRKLNLRATTIDDEGLAHLGQLSRLTHLDLSGTLVGDEGVKHLTKLTSLQELNLDDTDITDRSVEQLASLPWLNWIDLSNTRVTPEAMLAFPVASHPIRVTVNSSRASFPTLWDGVYVRSPDDGLLREGREDLRMNRPLGKHVPKLTIDSEIELTPERLDNLSKLRNVPQLTMRGAEIGDAQLAHLKAWTIVRRACFDRTSIGHEGFKWLGGLATLRQLTVVGSPVAAQDIAELSKLEILTTLSIRDCSIDNETLRAILSLRSVRNLELTRCALPANAVEEFKQCTKGFHRLSLNGTGMSPEDFRANVTSELFDFLTWDGIDLGESVTEWFRGETSEPHSGLVERGVPQSRMSVLLRRLSCPNVDWDEGWRDGLSLRSAFIQESHILEALAIWSHASAVDFSGAELGPATMDALASSRCLERLALARTKVSDRDLRHAAGWTSLVHLDLAGCPITDAGVTHLESCWRLERLTLDDTDISDESLKIIAKMPRLEFLSLRNTNITDAGLHELERLDHLDGLYVGGSQVTPDGVSDYRFARRNCMVDLQSRDAYESPTFRDD